MNIALTALVLNALWTVALGGSVVAWRFTLARARVFAPNAFPSGTAHGPERYWRLNRAHINAAENLSIFAVAILAGRVAGVDGPVFAVLAVVALLARVTQSTVHVASNRNRAVLVRATAFFTQLVCLALMLLQVTWKILG